MRRLCITFVCLFGATTPVLADPATELLNEYRKATSSDTTFDAEAGKRLWYRDNDGRSCASCHGDSPRDTGSHARTGKTIDPMAPTVNAKRLTDKRKMKKWFLRNCKWTLGRECTPQEKGNILTWLRQQ